MGLLRSSVIQTAPLIVDGRILDTYSTGIQLCLSLTQRRSTFTTPLVAYTGGYVTAWYDQSGNGYNAFSASTYAPAYTGVERYLDFTYVLSDFSNGAYLSSTFPFNSLRSVNQSVYAVFNIPTTPQPYSGFLCARGTASNANIIYGMNPNSAGNYMMYDFNEATPTYNFVGAQFQLNTKFVWGCTISATQCKQYTIVGDPSLGAIDVKTFISPATSLASDTSTVFSIGQDSQGGRYCGSYISDILAYNVLHTDAQAEDIMNRL